MENPITVYDEAGVSIELRTQIGSGAQGRVYGYTLDGEQGIAYKIFDEKQLQNSRLKDKIRRMVEIGEANDKALIRHHMIAWPQFVVYDENRRFIGYAMKRAEGVPLDRLAHSKLPKKYFPDIDREKVAKMLIKLWETADVLHDHGVFIGDVNLFNILCDRQYRPCLIDVDSYQMEDYACPVGRPEMTPPEQLDDLKRGFETITRNRESDIYSLAIVAFQCFMSGTHPFTHIGGGSPLENQKRGKMPYLKGEGARPGEEGGVPPGRWYQCWKHYPYYIKQLFGRTLKDGATVPANRAGAKAWIYTLKKYIRQLNSPTGTAIVDATGEPYRHCLEMMPAGAKPAIRKIGESDNASQHLPSEEGVSGYSISAGDMIDNPSPRCPLAFVLDTSDNMGESISALNQGMRQFVADIHADDFSRHSVELMAFTCGGRVTPHFDFSNQEQRQWDDAVAGGTPLMAEGALKAIDALSARRREYDAKGISSYRPWLVLIAASAPSGGDLQRLEEKLGDIYAKKSMYVFVAGVGNLYNTQNWESLCERRPECKRLPKKMHREKFPEFFSWLARNLAEVSQSVPGYERRLSPVKTWADE